MKKVIRRYTAKALKDLQSLDKKIAQRIVAKVKVFSEDATVFTRAKALTGSLVGLYRYRVGDYRVIFEVNESGSVIILMILNIKHRKDVYR